MIRKHLLLFALLFLIAIAISGKRYRSRYSRTQRKKDNIRNKLAEKLAQQQATEKKALVNDVLKNLYPQTVQNAKNQELEAQQNSWFTLKEPVHSNGVLNNLYGQGVRNAKKQEDHAKQNSWFNLKEEKNESDRNNTKPLDLVDFQIRACTGRTCKTYRTNTQLPKGKVTVPLDEFFIFPNGVPQKKSAAQVHYMVANGRYITHYSFSQNKKYPSADKKTFENGVAFASKNKWYKATWRNDVKHRTMTQMKVNDLDNFLNQLTFREVYEKARIHSQPQMFGARREERKLSKEDLQIWTQAKKNNGYKLFKGVDLEALGKPVTVSEKVVNGLNYFFTFANGTEIVVFSQFWTNTLKIKEINNRVYPIMPTNIPEKLSIGVQHEQPVEKPVEKPVEEPEQHVEEQPTTEPQPVEDEKPKTEAKKSKLSGGVIAGIVIGCVAFLALAGGLTYWFYHKKN